MVGFVEGTWGKGGLFAIVLIAGILSIGATALAATSNGGGAGVKPLSGGGISSTTPPKPEALPTGPAGRTVFPIRGAHEYWEGFGGASGHEGVDIGARCGTPLVAAQTGRVRFAKYHARAGNYVVIDLVGSSLDLAYMHLTEPAAVLPGQSVVTGQPIGTVGDTGNASGCHLHFEVWEGPYYGGGAPIDPMPFLLAWDRDRKKRAARQAPRS